MKAFVEVDGVLSGDNLFLSSFAALVHHFGRFTLSLSLSCPIGTFCYLKKKKNQLLLKKNNPILSHFYLHLNEGHIGKCKIILMVKKKKKNQRNLNLSFPHNHLSFLTWPPWKTRITKISNGLDPKNHEGLPVSIRRIQVLKGVEN